MITVGKPRRNGSGRGYWWPLLYDGAELVLLWSASGKEPPSNLSEFLNADKLADSVSSAYLGITSLLDELREQARREGHDILSEAQRTRLEEINYELRQAHAEYHGSDT